MKKFIVILIVLLTIQVGCKNILDEEVYSDLGPSNFYSTAEDAETILNAAYAQSQGYGDQVRDWLCMGEAPTEVFIERKGAIYSDFQPIEEFTWDASHSYLKSQWTRWYCGVFYANIVIDHVPSIAMDEDRKEQILAEARFLRALNYFWLYDFWGPVPLITTSNTTPQDRPLRPTNDEFIKFLEDEFIACSEVLPLTQNEFPRATKGAALGFLTKFYLNNKKWSLAAETAETIIENGTYALFVGDTSRAQLFDLEKETCNEFIFVSPFSTKSVKNTYLSHAVPDKYKWKYNTMTNFAANFCIPTSFLNTFDPNDTRLDAFIFKYYNTSNVLVTCGTDNVRSFKYVEDPNAVGAQSSNDFPLLRYADILLSRAEALNELNGPTQESIDLINQVRSVAGVADRQLADYTTKESLRDAILAERSWEFHTEGLRRQDLIRQGKFISNAVARGKPAKDYMVLYPIPQSEISANPNLVQNEGYGE